LRRGSVGTLIDWRIGILSMFNGHAAWTTKMLKLLCSTSMKLASEIFLLEMSNLGVIPHRRLV
jgi:hypothetical protein